MLDAAGFFLYAFDGSLGTLCAEVLLDVEPGVRQQCWMQVVFEYWAR
jgi:hypothetical protein